MAKIDERRSTRSKVMLAASIESDFGRVEIRVDELSAHGVRVFGAVLFPVDTPVSFQCKSLIVEGYIAWVEAPLAGIGFGEPVQPQEALRTITRARQTIPKDFRRPGFRARQLTEIERQSVEEWAIPQQM